MYQGNVEKRGNINLSSINKIKKCFLIYVFILSASCSPEPCSKYITDLSDNNKKVHDFTTSNLKEDSFKELMKSAKNENKKVFLLFSFSGCAICKIFEKYHNDPVVKEILRDNFIIAEIDIDHTPGGSQLYSIYGRAGFPSWSIIDSSKSIIDDSGNLEYGYGNMGFPYNQNTRGLYINALKKAAPSLSDAKCTVLIKKLKYYRPDKKE
jgi:hypothetical protein